MRSVALFFAELTLLFTVVFSVALLASALMHGWTSTGPNCPAPADPQWIGWCSEAPSKP